MFFLLFFTSSKIDLNKKLISLKIDENILISKLVNKESGSVYIFKGNLSEKKFLKYCNNFNIIDNYEFWEICLLVVDENCVGNIYIIHPFYESISTLNIIFEVDFETSYDVNTLRIKRINDKDYVIYKELQR